MYQFWISSIAWVSGHKPDIAVALVLAFVCYVLAELVKTGSVAAVRKLKNKLSEVSVSRLRKRIGELEAHRDMINSFAQSDRALYLAALQLMFVILMLGFLGMLIVSAGVLLQLGAAPLSFAASILFTFAMVLSGYGATIAALNTRPKIIARVRALDFDIDDMKAKLDSRTRKTVG
jgi:hypothetical protein